MRRFSARSLSALFWDFLPAPILAWYAIKAISAARGPGWFPGMLLIMGEVIFPACGVLWLQLRMSGRVSRLCERARREEIALTFLKPAEYLWPRLWPVAARALAPFAAGTFALTCSEAAIGEGVVLAYAIACAALTGWLLTLLGVVSLVVRQCREIASGLALIPRTIGWFALAAAGGCMAFVSVISAWEGERPSNADGMPPSAALLIGVISMLGIAVMLLLARGTWKRACEAYYRFD